MDSLASISSAKQADLRVKGSYSESPAAHYLASSGHRPAAAAAASAAHGQDASESDALRTQQTVAYSGALDQAVATRPSALRPSPESAGPGCHLAQVGALLGLEREVARAVLHLPAHMQALTHARAHACPPRARASGESRAGCRVASCQALYNTSYSGRNKCRPRVAAAALHHRIRLPFDPWRNAAPQPC